MDRLNTPVNSRWGMQQLQYTYTWSRTEVTFLDFTAYKGERWAATGILDIRLHVKPGNPLAYLPCSSCHPHWIAKGWIKAEMIRRCITNSSEANFKADVALFAKNLIARSYSGPFVRSIISSVQLRSKQVFLVGRKSKIVGDKSFYINFINTFHPQLPRFKCFDLHKKEAQKLGLPDVSTSHTVGNNLVYSLLQY